ncbi:MAG: methionine adenosyltransferase [Nitrososphaerota archaeon]
MQKTKIIFERIRGVPVYKHAVEIVERKGLGHPDYMIDAACEASSVALSKYYIEKFGRILHHNLDKGLLVGGKATPRLGGGTVDEPIYILIAGRATLHVNAHGEKHEVPIGRIVQEAVKNFIRKNFRFLDPDRHVVIDYKIRQGSEDLINVVEAETEIPLSNDTSFGVGYAPFTPLEKLVLETERLINSQRFKSIIQESGEDCKVMGIRMKDKIVLTIADGIVSHLTPDLDHYISVKEEIADRVSDLAAKLVENCPVDVYVNTADKIVEGDPENSSIYLTVTGTSAEHGDDGNTGRGNRASGLITPNRQMSLEATAGKNAISHVGKIYNVIAFKIADKIYRETGAFEEIYVRLLSQIGRRIDRPLSISIQYIPSRQINSAIKYEVSEILLNELKNITKITDIILEGKAMLF